jgi:hypothetical protein
MWNLAKIPPKFSFAKICPLYTKNKYLASYPLYEKSPRENYFNVNPLKTKKHVVIIIKWL